MYWQARDRTHDVECSWVCSLSHGSDLDYISGQREMNFDHWVDVPGDHVCLSLETRIVIFILSEQTRVLPTVQFYWSPMPVIYHKPYGL